MGVTSCEGAPFGVCVHSQRLLTSSNSSATPRSERSLRPGSSGPTQKECHSGGRREKGFLQPTVCDTQKRRGVEANHQSETAQPVLEHNSLQNGGSIQHQGCDEETGLANEDRPKGCVPDSANPQEAQTLPQISMEEQSVRVQGPSIWIIHSTEGLHENSKTSGSETEKSRSKVDHIPRRYLSDRNLTVSSPTAHSDGDRATSGARLHTEPEEVCSDTESRNGVLGVHSEFHRNDLETTGRENYGIEEGLPSSSEQGECVDKRPLTYYRSNDFDNTGSPQGASILQRDPEAEECLSQEAEII